MCSERVNRSLADPAASVRSDLSVAQLLMGVAFDTVRRHRRRFDEYLQDPAVDLRRDSDARRAFDLLDEVVEGRAFARDCRQTVRFLRTELDRLAVA